MPDLRRPYDLEQHIIPAIQTITDEKMIQSEAGLIVAGIDD